MHPVASRDPFDRSSHPLHAVALIPARFGSTRFPGKPLADIDGRPMIEHVYRRALQARRVDAVAVATDDTRIAEAVTRFGGIARMTSSAHRSGTDRLAEAAADLVCDIVVNVQGDEPLLDPESIDAAVGAFDDPSVQMATLSAPLAPGDRESPHVVKVVVDRRGDALYFSRAPLAAAARHIGLYAYRRPFLLTVAGLAPTPLEEAESLEQLRVLEHGYRIRTVPAHGDAIAVDTPEDLDRVRRRLAASART